MYKTTGEIVVETLVNLGAKYIFGIPGVHSVELYRGLKGKRLKHITPRHEQGAGFMADGYARKSGSPGVCFVITGPGLTNIITPIAQAYADRVPILVISAVNPTPELGNNTGLLHSLPDQTALIKTVAIKSYTIKRPSEAAKIIAQSYFETLGPRKGPVVVQIPTDVLEKKILGSHQRNIEHKTKVMPVKKSDLLKCTKLIRNENKIIILAGGGAKHASSEIIELSETLSAPVVLTINARGMMQNHPMVIPASPSLPKVRKFLEYYDLAIIVGSEVGSTDYNMFGTEKPIVFKKIIRVDLDPKPNANFPKITLNITQDAKAFIQHLNLYLLEKKINKSKNWATSKNLVAHAKKEAKKSLTLSDKKMISLLNRIYQSAPSSVIVGDSTKPVYAGNNFLEAPAPNTWFNAATGFGALGYATPASIGAKIAEPKSQIICLIGDGGFQFSMSEIGTAYDQNLDIIYLIWNNFGYKEIADFMQIKKIKKIGVTPYPPNHKKIADAYSMPYFLLERLSDTQSILDKAKILMRKGRNKPCMIEVIEKSFIYD